jgi:tetratricopeptide (TPR) repeat protein
MCLRLLRLYWSRPGLELFGKRGERQFGIDILDVGGEIPIYAAQCKLKEEHKSLPPTEIQNEVDEAKKFTPPLGKYAILTTAKVSTQAQRKVREINQSHKAQGLFELEVLNWDRLCPLLQQYTEVQEHFYGDLPVVQAKRIETQLVAIKGGLQSLTSRTEGDAVDDELNEARDCIGKREFQFATFLLNRVQRRRGQDLTQRQKFRLFSNQGAALLGVGRAEEAAKLFLEALQWEPNDEQARINEALAYFLVGDLPSCHTKASLLREDYPASSRLAALWVNSAPKEAPFSTLESEINTILKSDSEVCVALARRASGEFDFDNAFKYARTANTAAPTWSQPQLLLAQINLGNAIRIQSGFPGTTGTQERSLREAEEACSKAIDLAREERDKETEKASLVLRIEIRLLLSKPEDAIEDAQNAERLDPNNIDIMLSVAQVRYAYNRNEDAISLLQKAWSLSKRPDVAFVYGTALQNRGRDVDLEEALSVFRQISLPDLRAELRPTTVTHTVQCFAKKKDWLNAEKYIQEASAFLDASVVHTMQGYLAHYQGKAEDAERHALEARSLLTTSVTPDTRDSLARLLMLIGRPADALPLWQDLFDRGASAFDPKNLLKCAAKLQRDDIVMETCERLRARGVDNWNFFEFELQYLEKYKIDLAIERLQAFVAQNPENRLAKLRLSLIGLRLNKPELVRSGAEDIPSLTELPINYTVPAVQVLKYGGNPNAAVDYAYRFLREHFNEIEAHQALISSMMPGAFSPDIPPILEAAGPDSAVCYQELPVGNAIWAVLEDTDKPNGDFEEISLSSELAVRLTGKKVGDTFVLAKGQIQDRSARILQIMPKYVRRYQDSMGEMQVRFGAASSVESVRIEQPEGADQGKSVAVLLASAEKRAAAVVGARGYYSNQLASLHWYGSRFGKDAYSALLSLAQEDGQKIKCCFGTPEERSQGLQALQTAKVVVVDLTSLATLRLLGLEKVLSSAKFHFVVSERTWVNLREMLSEARLFSAPGGTLLYKNGKPMLVEITAEDRARWHKNDEDFVRLIEETTERRSEPRLATVEPEKREALESFFGSYGAEAMVLASDPDYVLWTDDLIQAQVSMQEFGCRRVWTQLLLGVLTNAGLLTADEYSDASAKLLGMEFVSTTFDAACALAAFRLASWSVEKSPASQLMAVFSDQTADLEGLFRICVEFMVRLFREPVLPEIRCSVAREFLDAFADRRRAIDLLKSLRQQSSVAFGVNALGKDQFDECFDRWLERRGKSLIVLP